MGIQRSSFRYRKKRLSDPAHKIKAPADNVILFREYHLKYPSHGYRWLSAKIRPDTGLKVSDTYAHKCCKIAGMKSRSRHYRYKKPGEPRKVYPNPKIEEMEEQNYNMVDNVLNNGAGEKAQKEENKKAQDRPAAKPSLKARLAEKKAQVAGQGREQEENIKNKQREM